MRTGLASTLTGSSLFSFQGTGAVQRRIPSLSRSVSDVKRFFLRRLGGGGSKGRLPCARRILLAGKIWPGHRRGREDTEAGGGCQALFFPEREVFFGGGEDQAAFTQGMGPDEGDPKRRGRRLGIELPPLRQGRKAPYPSKGQGVTAAALPGPSGCPEGRRFHPAPAIPRKWDSPPCARNPKPATPRLRPGR